jgi:hypothetical protein
MHSRWRAIRIAILPAILVLEIVLVASLRTRGWEGTGSSLLWAGSIVAALIPLLIAAALLFRKGLRFDLRTLLVVTALVSIFVFIAVLPLLDAYRARRATRQMIGVGAIPYIRLTIDEVHFYRGLSFHPRSDANSVPLQETALPPWLMPLTGDLLDAPESRSVKEFWLSSDAAIDELCRMPENFPKLQRISVTRGVSAEGMKLLRRALPQFAGVVDVHLNSVLIPEGWLRSLENVQALYLWIEGWPVTGPMKLSVRELEDVASMPDLQFLMILGHQVSDNDIAPLSQSKSLRRVILRNTSVTEPGRQFLEDSLPDATVQF